MKRHAGSFFLPKIAGVSTAVLVALGSLSAAAPKGKVDPVHVEWRQRISQTARKTLLVNQRNPFLESTEAVVGSGKNLPGTEREERPVSTARSATSAATGTWSFTTRLPNPYRLPSELLDREELSQWDWRERLRWFLKMGLLPEQAGSPRPSSGTVESGTEAGNAPLPEAGPQSATGTPDASQGSFWFPRLFMKNR